MLWGKYLLFTSIFFWVFGVDRRSHWKFAVKKLLQPITFLGPISMIHLDLSEILCKSMVRTIHFCPGILKLLEQPQIHGHIVYMCDLRWAGWKLCTQTWKIVRWYRNPIHIPSIVSGEKTLLMRGSRNTFRRSPSGTFSFKLSIQVSVERLLLARLSMYFSSSPTGWRREWGGWDNASSKKTIPPVYI